jgi:40-residue YVTN family beta-propeller repeat
MNNESSKNLDKIYDNPVDNFKISHPSAWKELSNGNNVTLVSPLENKSDSFQEKITFTVNSTGNIKLLNMMSIKITDYRENLDGFRLLDFKHDLLGGNPAYMLTYSYKQGNMSLTNLEILTSVGTKTYSFHFISQTNKFNIYFPIIQKMLNTIEIQGLTTPETRPSQKLAELGISIDPYAMVADPITKKLYITNLRFHTVSVIDSSTDKMVKEIKVGRYPTSIGIDTGVNNIFVTNSRSNTVSVIDISTDEVVKSLEVGNEPALLIVDDSEKGLDSLVLVANSRSNSISLIDGDKMEVMKEHIQTKDIPSDIALNKITNRLYVTHKDSDSVSVIDYFLSKDSSFHYNNITTIKVGKYPTGINVNLDTNKIYVANSHANSVSVIDGTSNTVEKIVPVGVEPADVEVNRDTNKIYVSNYQNNSVSVINGTDDSIITNVPVGRYPDAVYLNPTNDIVYVVNVGSSTISQIQDTELLTGVTYYIDPQKSGQIECNGEKISGNEYVRYSLNAKIECVAFPSPEYKFKSWSANLNLNSRSDSIPKTTFNSTRYGNISASFEAPVVLNLPEGYWDQVRLAVASVVIPAVIGWLVPSIASFINGFRQRRSMKKTMDAIIALQKNEKDYDKEIYTRKLLKIQNDIITKLTSGKISESHYEILNSKIGDRAK